MVFHTIQALLYQASNQLTLTSASPQLDARMLLAHVLNLDHAQLLAQRDQAVTPAQIEQFNALLERRKRGEPIAYLIGYREFYGLPFKVDQRVLVPRPETELLVELGLKWLDQQDQAQPRVADIGTGSGCIAIALAKYAPRANIQAVDLSTDALQVARQNAQLNQVQITFWHGNGVEPLAKPVDLILSNPPYTILAEIDANVRAFEPHVALDGGAQGLEIYRWLIPACTTVLRPNAPSAIMLEIGAWQGAAVQAIAHNSFPQAQIQLHQDLAGRDRVVTIELD